MHIERNRKRTIARIAAFGIMLTGGLTLPADAALEEVFWNGSTYASGGAINSDAYTDVAYRGFDDAYMTTRTAGGIAEISFSGGWNVATYPLGGAVYTAIAHKSGDSYTTVLATGGFAEISWNGSTFVQDTAVDTGTVFTDITYKGTGDSYMLTRADGGITEVAYSGGWITDDYAIGGVVFNAITHKTADSYLATLASGGFAEVFWNGSTFVKDATVDTSTVYTDVVYRGSGDLYILTRADGGITELSYTGGWNVVDYPVGGTIYNAIAHKGGDNYLASAVPVPEPASVCLLVVASLGCVRARRSR